MRSVRGVAVIMWEREISGPFAGVIVSEFQFSEDMGALTLCERRSLPFPISQGYNLHADWFLFHILIQRVQLLQRTSGAESLGSRRVEDP